MTTEDQYNSIASSLSILSITQATLVEKITAIEVHLTQLNSKVATQEANMNTMLLWKARIEGFSGAINMGWSTVLALLSGTGITIWYLLRK